MKPRPIADYKLEFLFLDDLNGETLLAYVCEFSGYYVIEYNKFLYRVSDKQIASKRLENCTFIGVV